MKSHVTRMKSSEESFLTYIYIDLEPRLVYTGLLKVFSALTPRLSFLLKSYSLKKHSSATLIHYSTFFLLFNIFFKVRHVTSRTR